MTSIYDDIYYIETLKDDIKYECIGDDNEQYKNESENIKNIVYTDGFECDEDVIELIECINRKNMFQKLLKETLEELNQTNPCLEPGKYHMLCLYSNRYNKFIDIIKYKILTYELKRLSRKKNKQLDWPWYWGWNWKFMMFMKRKATETIDNENYMNNKKRD